MGYTNYIENKPEFTDAQWVTFTNAVKKLFKQTKIPLAGPDGTGKPYISKTQVSFNGMGDEGSHETCVIDKAAMDYEFCKTNEKPYDAIVVAVYKMVKRILPSTIIKSDGGDDVFNDQPKAPVNEAGTGLTMCFQTTEFGYPIKLEQRANKKFKVTYGKEVDDNIDYRMACIKLGSAILHAAAAEGKLDNSDVGNV